jgi:hypothetical protein
MYKQNINHPPLKIRQRILDKYYNNLNSMDHIDALVAYRNDMQVVYKKYNSWMKIRLYKREYFYPKEEEYIDDPN